MEKKKKHQIDPLFGLLDLRKTVEAWGMGEREYFVFDESKEDERKAFNETLKRDGAPALGKTHMKEFRDVANAFRQVVSSLYPYSETYRIAEGMASDWLDHYGWYVDIVTHTGLDPVKDREFISNL